MADGLAIVEGKTRLKRRRASPQTITPEQIEIFFVTLADSCNVVRSARAAGFAANWAYRKRKNDAAFRNGWAASVREGYARLELVLLERAIKGTLKLVRTARGTDRVMREYSTALAVALLRRHAETAGSAQFEPGEEELAEVRERILERLEGLRRLANPVHLLLNADWDALMGGANLAVVGNETIQFASAVPLGGGRYRLSRLLRGRRGTVWAADNHVIGEGFYLVDQATAKPIDLPPSAAGVSLTATAHGIGDVAPLPVVDRPVTGESLRPPSPCHLRLWQDGTSIHAEWVRRSHRGWQWSDWIGVADDPFPELYRLTVTSPAGQVVAETAATGASFVISELPASSGDSILFSVAMIGPMALSHETFASIII